MSEETAPGDLIGPYRVVAPLEAGGMASLYLAHRPPGTDIVAVKVIRDQLREVSRIVRMFQDEVRTLTHVNHANVVRVLEAGEYAGGRYLAMEYVHGCSLARLVDELDHRSAPLPVSVAVHVGIEIAIALHAAHEAVDTEGRPLNIVHRDVSPQNVMISETGAVKLIDFGVAKATGRLEVTNARLIKGKLHYMAPEQASGKSLDRRTDLFALGILLWEMLTRRRFSAADGDLDLFTRLLDPKATPPSGDNADVSAELDALVLETLSKSPFDRPATGLLLAESLRASTPVEGGREALCALVKELFGAELAYTRQWIAESFTLPDDGTPEGHSLFDDDGSKTLKMGRDVLAAIAAHKLSSDAVPIAGSATWPQETSATDPTVNVRPPLSASKEQKRLDLTFTLLQASGPESTGARPIMSPYEGPSVVSDSKVGGGFDEMDDTDALAMKCLANLRHASWAGRPAGAPPSLSVIQPLAELEAAAGQTRLSSKPGRMSVRVVFMIAFWVIVGVGTAAIWVFWR